MFHANQTTERFSHLRPGALKTYLYHGPAGRRERDILQLSAYDVILTTYSTLRADCLLSMDAPHSSGTLQRINWIRVVLDEGNFRFLLSIQVAKVRWYLHLSAHYIKDRSTQLFRAVYSLNARHRWCLTGTPIQNRLGDFFSLLRFLRVRPFDDLGYFASQVADPLQRGHSVGLARLRSLVSVISMRRTKVSMVAEVKLPQREDRIEEIELTDEERRLYTTVQDEYQRFLRKAIENEQHPKPLKNILHIILNLRLITSHGGHMLSTALDRIQGPGLNTAALKVCELCECSTQEQNPMGLLDLGCHHTLCGDCSELWTDLACRSSRRCPLCYSDNESSVLSKENSQADTYYRPSSKVRALLKNIINPHEENFVKKYVPVLQLPHRVADYV